MVKSTDNKFLALKLLVIGVSALFGNYWLSLLLLPPLMGKVLLSPFLAPFLWFLPACIFPTHIAFIFSFSLFLIALAEEIYCTPEVVVSKEAPVVKELLGKLEKIVDQEKGFQELLQKEAARFQLEKEQLHSQLQEAYATIEQKEHQCRHFQELVNSYQDGSELKQLKGYFEEKKNELIESRRALFLAQEEIESLERKLQDEKEQLDLTIFQTSRELVTNLTREVETLHSERQLLEEIIAQLSKGGSHAAHTTSTASR